jgi:hypothetical protein
MGAEAIREGWAVLLPGRQYRRAGRRGGVKLPLAVLPPSEAALPGKMRAGINAATVLGEAVCGSPGSLKFFRFSIEV